MTQPLLISAVTLPDGTRTDLALADGRLVDPADVTGGRRVDADGLLALPGLVDLHTHLREPGKEQAETVATGTAAAARGGFTAVYAMANLTPVTDSVERVRHIESLAQRASAIVRPVGSITRNLDGTELSDIAGMAAAGVTLFSDDGKCVMDAGLLRRAMEAIAATGGVLAQHSQDHDLAGSTACCHESRYSAELGLEPWPAEAESIIVARDVQLAKLTGCRLHVCHLSTAESVEIVRWAKAKGMPVTAEVTPHHLLLTTALLESGSTLFKVNPPLRTAEHVEAVRQGLADGTIDVVGTDHAPHTAADKAKPFDAASPGMLGLEQALGVVKHVMVDSGRMDWATLAERMSHSPARIGRLPGQGEPLTVGSVANLVLIDPNATVVVDPDRSSSKSRNNPYAGLELPDPVVLTVCGGRVTFER